MAVSKIYNLTKTLLEASSKCEDNPTYLFKTTFADVRNILKFRVTTLLWNKVL